MSNQPFTDPDTVAQPEIPIKKSSLESWPKVVGLIGIALGAYALLGVLVSPLTNDLSITSMQEQLEGDALKAYEEMVASQSVQLVPAGILAVILIVASVMLLRKKPLAKPIFMVWAPLKILLSCYVAWWTIIHMGGLMEHFVDDAAGGGEVRPGFASMMKATAYMGAISGLIFSSALPVFLLVWLNLTKIRSEMADWK